MLSWVTGGFPPPTCGCSADAGGPPVPVTGPAEPAGHIRGSGSPVRTPRLATRSVTVLAVPLLLAGWPPGSRPQRRPQPLWPGSACGPGCIFRHQRHDADPAVERQSVDLC